VDLTEAKVEPEIPLGELAPAGAGGLRPAAAGGDAAAGRDAGRDAGDGVAGRDAAGRFRPDNRAALVHGGRSRQASTLQAPLREQIRTRVLSDLGADANALTATMSGLVDRFAETSLLCDAYFTFLQDQGGPIGTRGRQRAAVAGYLAALDRQMKLASMIGLTRRATRVPTLAEYLEQKRSAAEAPEDAT
jgi:hypothetical protein